MKKNLLKTGILAISMILSAVSALAQDEASNKSQEANSTQQGGESRYKKQSETKKNALKARADLHDRIAKAHKNAASCLKDGKSSESDCATQLSKECEATGASKECMANTSEGGMAGQMGSQQSSSS